MIMWLLKPATDKKSIFTSYNTLGCSFSVYISVILLYLCHSLTVCVCFPLIPSLSLFLSASGCMMYMYPFLILSRSGLFSSSFSPCFPFSVSLFSVSQSLFIFLILSPFLWNYLHHCPVSSPPLSFCRRLSWSLFLSLSIFCPWFSVSSALWLSLPNARWLSFLLRQFVSWKRLVYRDLWSLFFMDANIL